MSVFTIGTDGKKPVTITQTEYDQLRKDAGNGWGYARHRIGCAIHSSVEAVFADPPTICDCGFAETLKEHEELKEKK